jgi:hypothetical protein
MRAPFRSSRPVLLLFLGLSLALVHGRDENINKAVEFRRRARPSRYLQPWQVVPRLHLPSLECARHRVLYSPLRVLGSDGLGHGMATKNSEITTAIRLGVAYTHRAPKFGSLSLRNDQVMEDFFGWGRGEMSGERFHAENCEPTPAPREGEGIDAGTRDCNICSSIKESTALGMERLVEVPEDLSFRQFHDTDAQVRELVMQNNGSHTVFQMGRRRCGSYPILVDFSRSRPWFYHKYWAQHAVAEDDFKTQSYALYGAPNAAPQDEGGPVSASLADNPLQFNDHELTIAVHVRRGDFFKATNRKMINDTTYVSIIRNVQDLVEEAGGPFAAMPTAVYIYSEGRPKVGKTFLTHIRTALTSEYLDVNGVVQDAKWWQSLIRQARPQERGRPVTRRDKTPKVPRVELRISRPTIETIHQMNHGASRAPWRQRRRTRLRHS